MVKKEKVFELKIEEDDDISGIDSISLVDEPAIEVMWVAFNKEQEDFHIPEGEDELYLNKLLGLGHSENDLLDEGWEVYKIDNISKEDFFTSDPNESSSLDDKNFLVRFKYAKNPDAPGNVIKDTTRQFCRELVAADLVYRKEDINFQNDFGASALKWRGGYNCRHLWQRIMYKRTADIGSASSTKGRVNIGPSYTIPGRKPQPNTTVAANPSFSKEKFESYSDYPESVKNNAKAVLKYVEENGWGPCGTPVGKQRANQLANGEPISADTIKRMYSYLSRHKGDLDSSKGFGDGCGYLSYMAWGGLTALSWAENKVKQFAKEKFEKVSIDYDDTLSTDRGKELAKRLLSEGKDLHIVTRRQESDLGPVLKVADELGIAKSKVHATNGKLKWETIKRLGISKHYDNNNDEIKAIAENTDAEGIKFGYDVGTIGGYVDPGIGKKKRKKGSYLDEFEYLFNKEDLKNQHFASDDEKHIVLGPAMIPDMKIFRRDSEGNPYYVYFSSDTIKMIASKYMKNKYTDNNDMMHDGEAVPDVYVVESWIKESNNDKSTDYGFENLPVGTWFVSMKINNSQIWDKVKKNELNGFSVSGYFEEVATFKKEELFLYKVAEILKNIKD